MVSNQKSDIAIIVLNWNNKEDTINCLQSLEKQEDVNINIIVVDNGSIDNPVPIIKDQFHDIDIIETGSNLGYAGGNNVGIRDALEQGVEFITVLNNDTVLDPNCIRELEADLKSHPEAAAAAPKSYFYDKPEIIYFAGGEIDPLGSLSHIGYGDQDGPVVNSSRETEWLSGCAIMFTRKALREVGLFDKDYFLLFEDADWSLRAKKKNYRLRIVPSAILLHKVSQSFGDTWSPSYFYYYTRNYFLWIERNFPIHQRPRFFHHAVIRIRYFSSNREDSSSYYGEKKFRKAIWIGLIDYIFRRFGKCSHSF